MRDSSRRDSKNQFLLSDKFSHGRCSRKYILQDFIICNKMKFFLFFQMISLEVNRAPRSQNAFVNSVETEVKRTKSKEEAEAR